MFLKAASIGRLRVGLTALSALLALLWLGDLEVQPFDESYYALRVKAILFYDCWLDQLDYDAYAGTHPPLYVWLAALTAKLFGLTSFALRFWSWISFVISVWMVGRIAAIRGSQGGEKKERTELIVIVCLGFSPFVVWFGRLGQLDMIAMMLSCGQVYGYSLYLKRRQRRFLIFSGAMLGLSLLAKVLVGGFAAAAILLHSVVLWRSGEFSVKDLLRVNGYLLGIGLPLGLWWFVVIFRRHEGLLEHYLNAFIFDRISRNQTAADLRTGYFYYANIILTRFPLSALCALWLQKYWREKGFRTPPRTLWVLWFGLVFITLSIAQTKLLWYALLFVPPLILITAESIELLLIELTEPRPKSRTLTAVLALLLMVSSYSVTQAWHRGIFDAGKTIVLSGWNAADIMVVWRTAALVCLCAASVAIAILAPRSMLAWFLPIGIGIASFFLTLNTVVNTLPLFRIYTGIEAVRQLVVHEKPSKLIHLVDSARFRAPTINPQLSYYLDGIDLDTSKWHPRISFSRTSTQQAVCLLPEWLRQSPDALVIAEKQSRLNSRSEPELKNDFEVDAAQLGLRMVLDSGDYTVYKLPP